MRLGLEGAWARVARAPQPGLLAVGVRALWVRGWLMSHMDAAAAPARIPAAARRGGSIVAIQHSTWSTLQCISRQTVQPYHTMAIFISPGFSHSVSATSGNSRVASSPIDSRVVTHRPNHQRTT